MKNLHFYFFHSQSVSLFLFFKIKINENEKSKKIYASNCRHKSFRNKSSLTFIESISQQIEKSFFLFSLNLITI